MGKTPGRVVLLNGCSKRRFLEELRFSNFPVISLATEDFVLLALLMQLTLLIQQPKIAVEPGLYSVVFAHRQYNPTC